MTSKVISEVNDIFEVLNERIRGYEKARDNVQSPEYKSLFEKYAAQSRSFEQELAPFSDRTPEEVGTRAKGDLWRFWMDIKDALTSDSDEAMLKASINGEEAAIDQYQDVLEDRDLPTNLRARLDQQLVEIRAAHGNLVRLRDIE